MNIENIFKPTLESAKAAEMSSVIKDTGAYIGVIKSAMLKTSENGVMGIAIEFVAEEGRANLVIWTHNAKGEELFGFGIYSAICGLLGYRNTTPEIAQRVYKDRDGVERKGNFFIGLEGKLIGFFLQREEYINRVGKNSYRLNIKVVFDPATGQTFSEKLANKEPKKLRWAKENLKDLRLTGPIPVTDTMDLRQMAEQGLLEPNIAL